jgi:hypothetical protein
MGNTLAVKATADVVDLQAKFAIARAETNSLASEMNKLAKQSAAGLLDPAGDQQLRAVAASLVEARGRSAELGAELRATADSAGGLGSALSGIRGQLSTAFEITGIAAAYEGIRQVGEVIEQLGDRAVQVQTLSAVLNVSTSEMQALKLAASEVGVPIESVARVVEKLDVLLGDARADIGPAIQKLSDLGITADQIKDPLFDSSKMIQALHASLTDSHTAVETHNALLKELGARGAQVVEVIRAVDLSEQGVAKSMKAVNGLTGDHIGALATARAEWDKLGSSISNAMVKSFLAIERGQPFEAPEPAKHAAAAGGAAAGGASPTANAADGAAKASAALSRSMLEQEMENVKAGVDAFKAGTLERLQALQDYAKLAKKFYGADTVDTVVKANQAAESAQREYTEHSADLMRQATQTQLRENQRVLDDRKRVIELGIADNGRYFEEYARNVQEQERLDKQRYDNKLRMIHSEIEEDGKILEEMQRNSAQQAKLWKTAIGEIEGAEGSFISDMISRRRSMSQSLLQIGGELLTKELTNDAKALTTRLLLRRSEEGQTRAMEEGGFLYHALFQNQKAAATITSEAAQTSATIAGAAARTSATAAAASVAHAQSAAIGGKTVLQDAAKAFSGTYSSVAQIPYVGWILAPAAAAAAYAAVAAYEGLASLDTGAMNLSTDGMYKLHKGEAVVPRPYAEEARRSGTMPGMGGGGGKGGGDTHNYGPVTVADTSMRSLLANRSNQRAVFQSLATMARRGAR